MSPHNIAASVRARLLNKARAEKLDFNLLLTRYALERILYRLSVSGQRDQFLLKGALLFDLWFDVPHRPTHDADLLCFGSTDIPHLENLFREISQIEGNDGIEFQPNTVKAVEIRKEVNYAGIRVTLLGLLDGARCPVQIDVGFGDAVTPAPEEAQYPAILGDMPSPCLRIYPRYTVVAEKLEAMVSLGMLNSRLKDYFDLWILALYSDFEGVILCKAIRSTFERRRTAVPNGEPDALSAVFAEDEQKNKQWQAFQRKNRLEPIPLTAVIDDLRKFLLPMLNIVATGAHCGSVWWSGKSWNKAEPQHAKVDKSPNPLNQNRQIPAIRQKSQIFIKIQRAYSQTKAVLTIRNQKS